ncbi:testis-expressed protein 47 isoform X2 [Erpetoichthys calabaricus]|uniref:BLUF domain-containing protein n=1 Tax=Erpetoichthys calabaricus TaxID=27687 RepID=A0A8C4TFC7_ERPCA|nr:testis-expressed protein 47 isoform X2 [Erpetoichthys calabaricus]
MEANKQGGKTKQPVPQKVGNSLYHHLLDKRALLNPKEEMRFLLHRLIFIAKISPELADRRTLGGYYERLYQNLQRYYPGVGITGLLLLYPSQMVHMVESSSDVLYSILRDLRDAESRSHSPLILEPKVLVMSHDIPHRLFQQWTYKVLSIPSSRITGQEHEEPTGELILESLSVLLKLGMHFLTSPKASKNSADSAVFDKVPELILPEDTIKILLKCKQLLTPEEYLKSYDGPLDVMLDSEFVWPPAEHFLPLD